MTAIGWDSPLTYWHLGDLHARQVRSRVKRSWHRIRSPRRAVATALAVVCLIGYAVAGLTVLAQRTPVDPERLRLWLSGSMVIYALYHLTRSVWTANAGSNHTGSSDEQDSELSAAAKLWLAGAPVQRSSLLGYELIGSVTQAVVKTILLALILFHDVARIELLFVAMLGSIVFLEIVRRMIDRAIALLSRTPLIVCRAAISLAALAVLVTVLARVASATPSGSPTGVYLLASVQSLGDLASSGMIQTLATPWFAASTLAVTADYSISTALQLAATISLLPLGMLLLTILDREAIDRRTRPEVHQTTSRPSPDRESSANIRYRSNLSSGKLDAMIALLPAIVRDAAPLALRQAQTLKHHAGTVIISLLIPTLLSLSPLLIDTTTEQWLFVIGGVTLSTLLLAPPALRLDFRRDVRRLSLLAGLPLAPRTVVAGQLFVPVSLTIAFQLLVLTIASCIVQPGMTQVLLWFGLLPPFAVMVFAAENAIFLAFPHQEHAEGIAMVIRTKVIFLAKAVTLLTLLGLLVAWAIFCRRLLPISILAPVYVGSSIVAGIAIAAIALNVTARVWRRLDCSSDMPIG